MVKCRMIELIELNIFVDTNGRLTSSFFFVLFSQNVFIVSNFISRISYQWTKALLAYMRSNL